MVGREYGHEICTVRALTNSQRERVPASPAIAMTADACFRSLFAAGARLESPTSPWETADCNPADMISGSGAAPSPYGSVESCATCATSAAFSTDSGTLFFLKSHPPMPEE